MEDDREFAEGRLVGLCDDGVQRVVHDLVAGAAKGGQDVQDRERFATHLPAGVIGQRAGAVVRLVAVKVGRPGRIHPRARGLADIPLRRGPVGCLRFDRQAAEQPMRQ